MPTSCPICGKDDAIQKVSSVVSSGQFSGGFSGPTGGLTYSGGKLGVVGGYTTLGGSSSSALATLLAPPREPRKPSPRTLFNVSMYINIGLTWFFAFGCGGGTLASPGPVPLRLFGLLLVLAVTTAITCFLLWFFPKRREYFWTKYAQDKQVWNIAMERWGPLYYCFRDGIAFDPALGEAIQPAQLKAYLYAPKKI